MESGRLSASGVVPDSGLASELQVKVGSSHSLEGNAAAQQKRKRTLLRQGVEHKQQFPWQCVLVRCKSRWAALTA